MNEFDRDQWLEIAQERLRRAEHGTSKLRKAKNQRSSMASNFVEKAPTIHIEQDIALFIKAAEAFLVCGKWKDAGITYGKAAGMYLLELKARDEAAALFTEAGLAAEKFPGEGREYFKKAVTIYCDCKKFRQAARIRGWIGETHEANGEIKEAVSEFKMTAQYYKAAQMPQQVMHCQRKIGHLLAEVGDFDDASKVFQEVGQEQLRYNLTKYSARDSFFRAILLLLATERQRDSKDLKEVKDILLKLSQVDLRFEDSPHFDFLTNIINILEENGSEDDNDNEMSNLHHDFADHLYDYNEAYPFDLLNLQLLGKIYHLYLVKAASE